MSDSADFIHASDHRQLTRQFLSPHYEPPLWRAFRAIPDTPLALLEGAQRTLIAIPQTVRWCRQKHSWLEPCTLVVKVAHEA